MFVLKSSGIEPQFEEIKAERKEATDERESFKTHSLRMNIDPLTSLTIHNFSKDAFDSDLDAVGIVN